MRISDWSSDVCSSDLQAPRSRINAQLTRDVGRHRRYGHTQRLLPGLLAFLLIGAGEIIALIIAETAEFLFGRALADNDGDSLPLAVSDQFDRDRKSTRLNSSHYCASRMTSSACKTKNI